MRPKERLVITQVIQVAKCAFKFCADIDSTSIEVRPADGKGSIGKGATVP